MASKKMGRPRLEFNLEEVTKLAEIGATYYEMASFFDCSTSIIDKRMSEDETDPVKGDFLRAYKRGFGKIKRSLRRCQIETAMNGNPALLIWLGKNLLDQTDKIDSKQEVSSKSEVKMKITPEIEAQIKEAAQVVMNDRKLTPHG